MFGDGDDVFGAGFFEEVGPSGGVEMFGFEHGDEVFVAEFIDGAVGGEVVFVLFGIFAIHVAWIPLIAESGDGIDAPMDKDAKLGVFVPLGNFVGLEGLPIG